MSVHGFTWYGWLGLTSRGRDAGGQRWRPQGWGADRQCLAGGGWLGAPPDASVFCRREGEERWLRRSVKSYGGRTHWRIQVLLYIHFFFLLVCEITDLRVNVSCLLRPFGKALCRDLNLLIWE